MVNRKDKILNALKPISVALNVLTGGERGQTICARHHEYRRQGKRHACNYIDRVIFFDRDHCTMSWIEWKLSSCKKVK